jgi:hypothetical protein
MTASADNRPATRDPWDIGFGVVVLAVAVVALTVWFPNDIRGGVIVLGATGKPEPGDAFFPVILASLMGLLGAIQVCFALFKPSARAQAGRLDSGNAVFMAGFCVIVGVGLALMYWCGPAVVGALKSVGLTEHDYRQLTDTAPFKYIGYVVGGFVMTVAIVVRAEGMVRPRALLAVVLVIAFLVFVIDGLLSNVQLPPNAEY